MVGSKPAEADHVDIYLLSPSRRRLRVRDDLRWQAQFFDLADVYPLFAKWVVKVNAGYLGVLGLRLTQQRLTLDAAAVFLVLANPAFQGLLSEQSPGTRFTW